MPFVPRSSGRGRSGAAQPESRRFDEPLEQDREAVAVCGEGLAGLLQRAAVGRVRLAAAHVDEGLGSQAALYLRQGAELRRELGDVREGRIGGVWEAGRDAVLRDAERGIE